METAEYFCEWDGMRFLIETKEQLVWLFEMHPHAKKLDYPGQSV